MNLKPMSLNQTSKDITSNEQPLNYIKDTANGYGDILYLDTYGVKILDKYNGEKCHAYRTLTDNTGKEITLFRPTRLGFSKMSYIEEYLLDKEKKNMEVYNDIMILGTLCEILCSLRLPIDALIENTELIEEYVRKVLEKNIDFDFSTHPFNLTRAMDLLSESTDNCYSKSSITTMVLQGKLDNDTKYLKSLLVVNRNKILLIDNDLEIFSVNIPESIASYEHFAFKINELYDAIVWYLLAKSGYYCIDDDCFCNNKAAVVESTLNMNSHSQYAVFSTSGFLSDISKYY